MPDKNKGNLKSSQSKLWMEEALLKLMQTEKYREITIKEITDHAGLTRRTFYRNYNSKDDILLGCFNRIWGEYRELIAGQVDLSLPSIARVFFTQMRKHADFLALISRHQLFQLFLAQVDTLLPPAFDELKGKAMPFSQESVRYALTFSAGGFLHILIRWLDDGAQKTPEEMAGVMEDFIAICSYRNTAEG